MPVTYASNEASGVSAHTERLSLTENTMTKKHFEALAAEIRTIFNEDHRHTAAVTVAKVARQFNPSFDAARFYKACGVNV